MGDESSSDVAVARLDDEDPSFTAVAEEPAVTRERAPEIKPGDLLAGRYQSRRCSARAEAVSSCAHTIAYLRPSSPSRS